MTFSQTDFEPAQQGDLDGLCGVYTGVNFFCRKLNFEATGGEAKKIFRDLLSELNTQGKITVHRLCKGFAEGQLQKAFNKVAKKWKAQVKVQRLEVFINRIGAKTVFDAIAALEPGQAAMLNMNRGGHWVLAFGCDGKIMHVDDSSDEVKTITWQREDARALGLSKKNGLVFLNA